VSLRPLFLQFEVAGLKRTVIETTDTRGRPMQLSVIPIESGRTCVELKTRKGTGTGLRPRRDRVEVDRTKVRRTAFGPNSAISSGEDVGP
jgi:hypothetical protein